MAINPHNRYPGQTAAPSPAYPYGNARNQTVPGDRRGTPLERTWVSDLWGFFQAILTEAGITPSGTPDAANNSQYLSGLKKILSLQNLFDRTAADQGTPGSAQLEGKLLQIVDSVRSDIIAGDVEGAYARLRGEENLSHVVASAVEDEVYAALTSWLDTERARLSLRGTLREILGRDMAGDGAPISVPNGLSVGGSFSPPRGYLPMGINTFTAPGTHTWSRPAGCRAVKITCVGGGGGGGGGSGGGGVQETGGGGGGGATCFAWLTSPDASYEVIVGAGGASRTAGGSSSFGSDIAVAHGGQPGDSALSGFIAGGAGGHPQFGTFGFRGSDGGHGSAASSEPKYGGSGGSSAFGGGPGSVGNITSTPTPGISARLNSWGAGGGGALMSTEGGSGHRGIVIVESYA